MDNFSEGGKVHSVSVVHRYFTWILDAISLTSLFFTSRTVNYSTCRDDKTSDFHLFPFLSLFLSELRHPSNSFLL